MDDFDSKPSGRPSMDVMANEFARILRQQIEHVAGDPKEMRALIYELARVRLAEQFAQDDDGDTRRALHALESAIQQVEASGDWQGLGTIAAPSMAGAADNGAASATFGRALPSWMRGAQLGRSPGVPAAALRLGVRLALVLVLLLLAGSVALYWRHAGAAIEAWLRPAVQQTVREAQSTPEPPKAAEPTQQSAPAPAPPPSEPSFPLPTTFGVFVLNDGALQELKALPGKVPDRRVAISAAIATPSQTTVPSGDVKFIVFRPDMSIDVAGTVDVRVVARVTRAMGVDPTGKATMTNVADTWVIRSSAFPFKVGPVEDQPRMLLIQPETDGFVLTPGRYVLVYKGMGYDFSVDGAVTDPDQCVERFNATNGAFYSPCPKRR